LGRNYVLGLDLGTTLGVSRVSLDGGLDAQALRFEGNIESRTVGVHGVVQRFAGPDCVGVCIEEPFSGQFSSVKALFPMLGAAVLACELAGLPWSAIHLSKLKAHATGKGNAKKPEMQAAAKALGCRSERG
jgi:Holliday junction resolvasome RuvABC endonuclease subunit